MTLWHALERVVTLLLLYLAAHGAARAYGALAAINVLLFGLVVFVAIKGRMWAPSPPPPELRSMTLEGDRGGTRAAAQLGDTPDRVRDALDAFGAAANEEDGRPWSYASPRAAPPPPS